MAIPLILFQHVEVRWPNHRFSPAQIVVRQKPRRVVPAQSTPPRLPARAKTTRAIGVESVTLVTKPFLQPSQYDSALTAELAFFCLQGVVFEESAQTDVRKLYAWGCRVCGKREAQQWVRELRTAVSKQLAILPKGFPLVPEDDEFFRRDSADGCGPFRVLFTIKGHNVHVLHVRGAYVEAIDLADEDR